MTIESLILLILLSICHWAADFTHLSTAQMLEAKKFGTPLSPIFQHAMVHTSLMLIIIFSYFIFNGVEEYPGKLTMLIWLELLTHFGIDVLKGKLNKWFPSLQNPANKYHWYIFGADQFLHMTVIFLMVYILTN